MILACIIILGAASIANTVHICLVAARLRRLEQK